jgi:hypothetical protein
MNFVHAGSVRVAEPDADGQTMLNIIVGQQRALPTIQRIVEAEADPMTIDANGITSVHLALRLERKDIAWLLLTLWKTQRGFGDAAGMAGSNSVDCRSFLQAFAVLPRSPQSILKDQSYSLTPSSTLIMR